MKNIEKVRQFYINKYMRKLQIARDKHIRAWVSHLLGSYDPEIESIFMSTKNQFSLIPMPGIILETHFQGGKR